jgi:hypothetical protein
MRLTGCDHQEIRLMRIAIHEPLDLAHVGRFAVGTDVQAFERE